MTNRGTSGKWGQWLALSGVLLWVSWVGQAEEWIGGVNGDRKGIFEDGDLSEVERLLHNEAEKLEAAVRAGRTIGKKANRLFRSGEFEEADAILLQALQELPQSPETAGLAAQLQEMRNRVLLAQARGQFEQGNSEQAQFFLARIAEMQGELAGGPRRETKGQMLDEVDVLWERPEVLDRKSEVRPEEEGPGLRARLEGIILPRVNFSGMPLSRVIDTLSVLSEQYDEAGVGTNVVLIDPSDADPLVNITLRRLSLDRILAFVVESVGYEYDIQDDAVVVRPGTEGTGTRLETEFFPISRSTIIRLTGIGARQDGENAYSIDPFAPLPPAGRNISKVSEEEAALRNFLQRAGTPFDNVPGADLALADGQLIVTNTPRNIERVRNILRRYNEIKQVEIEAKFLEVKQGDLEELGVNWSVQRRGSPIFDSAGNPILNNRGQPMQVYDETYQSSNRSLAGGFGVDVAESDILVNGEVVAKNRAPDLPNLLDLAGEASAFANITGVIGEFEVNAIVRALSRKEGSDLMSAPKITVLSGKKAEIVVAQELRYPESYGDIKSEVGSVGSVGVSGGGSAGVTITAGTPRDFVTRNIGVEMEVTPTVEDDNSISLLLEPKVTEFEGFVEYGGPSIAISGGTSFTVPSGFFQPIFSVRRVRTEVTIWDGATVVMGGLTREQVQTVEDKVPILGDLPLLGRLFKSKGESTQKRNLLIFVTANLISPGGSPARQRFTNVDPGSLFQNPTLVTPGGAVGRDENK